MHETRRSSDAWFDLVNWIQTAFPSLFGCPTVGPFPVASEQLANPRIPRQFMLLRAWCFFTKVCSLIFLWKCVPPGVSWWGNFRSSKGAWAVPCSSTASLRWAQFPGIKSMGDWYGDCAYLCFIHRYAISCGLFLATPRASSHWGGSPFAQTPGRGRHGDLKCTPASL